MRSEFPTTPLGDLVENLDRLRVPVTRKDRHPGPYPYYGAAGIQDWVNDYIFEGPHLLVAEDGSVEDESGGLVLQLVDGKFWVNNHAHVLRASTPEDSRYLFYALRTVKARPFITGAVQQKISQRNLNRIPVPFPSEQTRNGISELLGVLDDKIELNRKMNRTLEEIAQAIFKSWFIDFDGVRTEDLVDSDIGLIPRTWEVKPATEMLSFNPRTALSKGTLAKFVDMKAVSTTGCSVTEVIEKPMTGGGSKFKQGDTLLARITPCLENGKTALVDFLDDGEAAFGSTEFIVIRPKGSVSKEWVYCLARSDGFRRHAISNMTGSSGRQRVPVGCFDHFCLPTPPEEKLVQFQAATSPCFERIKLNADESRTLKSLRDSLLPKLISGALRIPEAETSLEATA